MELFWLFEGSEGFPGKAEESRVLGWWDNRGIEEALLKKEPKKTTIGDIT